MKEFLDSLPKLLSHYCRKSSSKLYLERILQSKQQLFGLYVEKCHAEKFSSLSQATFNLILEDGKISLFSPKKDQCDLGCSYRLGNLSEDVLKQHTEQKEQARMQKDADKKEAQQKLCSVYTMDLQAVKVAPFLSASAVYYKTKLAVHNFTLYNLESHDAVCYWFDETQGELVASCFASCIVDTLSRMIKENPGQVILYSDGCTCQNRNVILSNALLRLVIDTGVLITQKFLEKGHTQMECDSVHSSIECKLKGREVTLPSQYAMISKEARKKPQPYEVHYLDYSFFMSYAEKSLWLYNSIRPGRAVKNEPTVNDLRALQYRPNGIIYCKCSFNEVWQELPRRPKKILGEVCFPKLYKERLKIKKSKWDHLQQLKSVLPKDCHSYYDNIPYE